MITNMLALEELIKAKLIADVADFEVVASWLDIQAETITQFAPAAYVLYGGYKIASDGPRGRVGSAVLIDQKWIVAIVARNAEGVLEGDKVKVDAGDLIYKAYKALNGVKLGTDYGDMKLVNAGQPPKYYPGVGVFPIGFECRFKIKGD